MTEEPRQKLARLPPLPTITRFSAAIIKFVTEEATKAREGESLLASTEVIESLIGKGKHLEGQQSGGGFTRMVLGMADAHEGVDRKGLCRSSHQGHRAMGSHEAWHLHAILSPSGPRHITCRNRSDQKNRCRGGVDFEQPRWHVLGSGPLGIDRT